MAPSPPAGQPEQAFQEVSVGIDVEGQFFEILGLLYGLSDMERLVRVDGLSLSPTEGETGEIIMATSLDVTIFTTSAAGVADVPVDDGTGDGGDGTGDGTTTTVPGDTGDGEALGVGG
jgi:hypothetical protein